MPQGSVFPAHTDHLEFHIFVQDHTIARNN